MSPELDGWRYRPLSQPPQLKEWPPDQAEDTRPSNEVSGVSREKSSIGAWPRSDLSRCSKISGEDIIPLLVCHTRDLRIGERRGLRAGKTTDGGSGKGVDLVGGKRSDLLRGQVRHFRGGEALDRVSRNGSELCR